MRAARPSISSKIHWPKIHPFLCDRNHANSCHGNAVHLYSVSMVPWRPICLALQPPILPAGCVCPLAPQMAAAVTGQDCCVCCHRRLPEPRCLPYLAWSVDWADPLRCPPMPALRWYLQWRRPQINATRGAEPPQISALLISLTH